MKGPSVESDGDERRSVTTHLEAGRGRSFYVRVGFVHDAYGHVELVLEPITRGARSVDAWQAPRAEHAHAVRDHAFDGRALLGGERILWHTIEDDQTAVDGEPVQTLVELDGLADGKRLGQRDEHARRSRGIAQEVEALLCSSVNGPTTQDVDERLRDLGERERVPRRRQIAHDELPLSLPTRAFERKQVQQAIHDAELGERRRRDEEPAHGGGLHRCVGEEAHRERVAQELEVTGQRREASPVERAIEAARLVDER